MRRSFIAIISLITFTACGGGSNDTAPDTSSTNTELSETSTETSTTLATPTTIVAPYTSEIYSDPTHWTCRPDMADTCDDDTSVTMINADGSTEVQTFAVDPDAPVDCFYAYPTASEDVTLNSDLIAGREKEVAFQQAARLSTSCRMFAPTYRSVTVAGLFNPAMPGDRTQAWLTPFEDIKDAWNHYLANDNQGRGVILLAHSQGTGQLVRLLKEVIDPSEAQRSILISAIMLGGAVAVPRRRRHRCGNAKHSVVSRQRSNRLHHDLCIFPRHRAPACQCLLRQARRHGTAFARRRNGWLHQPCGIEWWHGSAEVSLRHCRLGIHRRCTFCVNYDSIHGIPRPARGRVCL